MKLNSGGIIGTKYRQRNRVMAWFIRGMDVHELLFRLGRTGKIGDGKIFVVDVENAVRIRTGDRGDAALS